MTADHVRAAAMISRAYPVPVTGWAREIGLVSIVGERELFGNVYAKEIIVLATGQRGVADARSILEYEGENIVAFVPKLAGQMSLFPNGGGPRAS